MYFLFYFSILFLFVTNSSGDEFLEKLSNIDWVCANENFSEPISVAKVKQSYRGDHILKISFTGRETVNVLGKPSDENEHVWLVSVNEKYGVASKELLRETKILIPAAKCTKAKYDFSVINTSNLGRNDIKPDIKPSPAITVIEGTTISTNEDLIPEKDSSDDDPEVALNSDDNQSNPPTQDEIISNHTSSFPKSPDELNTKPGSSLEGIIQSPLGIGVDQLKSSQGHTDSNHLHKVEPSSDIGSEKYSHLDQIFLSKHLSEEGSSEHDPETSSRSDEKNQKKLSVSTDSSKIDPQGSPLVVEKSPDENLLKEDSSTRSYPELPHISENKLNETESLHVHNISSTQPDINDSLPTDQVSESTSEKIAPKSEHDSPISNTSLTLENIVVNEDNDTLVGSENSISHQSLDNITEVSLEKSVPPSLESIPQAPVPLVNDDQRTLESNAQTAPFESTMENKSQSPLGSDAAHNNVNQPELESGDKSGEKKRMNNEEYTNKSEESSVHSSLSNDSLAQVLETSPEESPQLTDEVTQNQKLDGSMNIVENNGEYATENSLYPVTENTNVDLNNNQAGSSKYSKDNIEEKTDEFQQQLVSPEPPQHFPGPISSMSSDLDFDKTSYTGSPTIETSTLTTPLFSQDTLSGGKEKQEKEKHVMPEIPKESDSFSEINSKREDLIHNKLPQEEEEHIHPSNDIQDDSSTNWFSPVSSVMNSFYDMFAKSDIGVDDTKTVQEFTTEGPSNLHSFGYGEQATFGDPQNVCEKDHFCDHKEESYEGNNEKDYQDFTSHSIAGLGSLNVSPSTLVCLVITSIAILLFSLGYYYLENLRQDTQLAARVNSLSAELFFAQKELATAEEQLTKTNENFEKLVSNSSSNEEALMKMKQELEDNEEVKQKLEQEIKRLEKEIESLVESSNEMHRMLAESISEDERTQALLANIDDLKCMVSSKLKEISSLTNQLDKEKQEVELLTIALKKSEEKKENLEEKLEKVMNEIDSKAMAVTKEFEEKIISLERIIEENSLERANFEKEIYELKEQCEKLSLEKELAEKSLKKSQGLGPAKALEDWLDTKEVRIELIASRKEVGKLKTELQESEERFSNLQEREKELLSELNSLRNNYETAEKNKIEALTKLQVLSNYFKEKETQLQEELGEKEAQWLQKQSEDHTIYEQMRSLREENLSYKAQNEALKREILDQEASFKIQVANEEQKAQEHWIQLRHTERRLKEAQMEASHLRSRLTAHETNPDSIEDKHNKSLDLVNGEVGLGAASPPFMLYPPPDFIPPPPLISPSRPPPLGRLSSPPMTPPPPLSPYDIFPPPPASPPLPLRVHKPQPREHPQKQKDSQSSNHSSESIEKPVRRGKR